MYLSTSTSTEDFPQKYLSTFQVLYKLYLSTDVLKYKVLLPGSVCHTYVCGILFVYVSASQLFVYVSASRLCVCFCHSRLLVVMRMFVVC